MTAVRQLIVESAINFQGYYKALWELVDFQKRQNPKSGQPGSLGFASKLASHWGAKQTALKSSRQKMEMPANLRMHLPAFAALWAER